MGTTQLKLDLAILQSRVTNLNLADSPGVVREQLGQIRLDCWRMEHHLHQIEFDIQCAAKRNTVPQPKSSALELLGEI